MTPGVVAPAVPPWSSQYATSRRWNAAIAAIVRGSAAAVGAGAPAAGVSPCPAAR